MKKKIIFVLLIIAMVSSCFSRNVSAADIDELELENLNMITEEKNASFEEIAKLIMEGEIKEAVISLCRGIAANFMSGEILRIELLKKLVIAGICSGILLTFINGENRELVNMSETIVKITIITLLQTFSMTLWEIAEGVLDFITEFMDALLPTMVVVLAACGKSVTSISFYETVMIVITVMQKLVKNIIFPLIGMVMYINIANYISKEKVFGTLSSLLCELTGFLSRIMLTTVLGFNVVKAMICPVTDSIKLTAMEKCISMLPGVGNTASTVTNVILGTGTLIKNTVGITACIVLCACLASPVLKLYLSAYAIKAAGGLFEIISDKSYVDYLSAFSDSVILLAATLCNTIFMFLITIGLVCASFG